MGSGLILYQTRSKQGLRFEHQDDRDALPVGPEAHSKHYSIRQEKMTKSNLCRRLKKKL